MLMNQTQGRRKGISTVIAGTIIILLIIVGVIPLLMLYLSTAQTMMSTYNVRVTYQEQKELERAEANVSNNVLTIANTGSIPIDISYLILSNSKGVCSAVLNLYDYINTTIPYPVIEEVNTTEIGTQKIVRIDPGGYIELNITSLTQKGISDVCSIVTARGNIIEVVKKVVIAEKARAVIATPITLDMATIANRSDITINENYIKPATPDDPGTGMTRVNYDEYGCTALLRYFEARNAKVIGVGDDGGCNITFNNILIGYTPEWSKVRVGSPKYNILLTGYQPISIKILKPADIILYTENQPYSVNIVNNSNYILIQITQNIPYRIKILGYSPEGDLILYYDKDYNGELDKLVNSDALGYWWLYSGQSIGSTGFYDLFGENIVNITKGYFELNGTADQFIIYLDASTMGLNIDESSYDPYIMSADVDGNTYPEFIFVTEDESCSSQDTFSGNAPYNDVGHYATYVCDFWFFDECIAGHWELENIDNTWADDWSTHMFLINLTGYPINGRDTTFVQVAIRVYVHDNLLDNLTRTGWLGFGQYPTTDEITDKSRKLLGVYLVNVTSGRIVGSREWCFEELDVLENTYPPSTSFTMLSATLPVPPTGTYMLAIGFQDPYGHTSDGKNDGDFIIAVEVIGITFYARS